MLYGIGFINIDNDQCDFFHDDVIILIYVHDCVILSKNKQKITRMMEDLKNRSTIIDEGNIE